LTGRAEPQLVSARVAAHRCDIDVTTFERITTSAAVYGSGELDSLQDSVGCAGSSGSLLESTKVIGIDHIHKSTLSHGEADAINTTTTEDSRVEHSGSRRTQILIGGI
jgi:hypothetical protein